MRKASISIQTMDNTSLFENISTNVNGITFDSYDYTTNQLNPLITMIYYFLWTVVTPIAFSIIIIIGTMGNFMVMYVIISRPKMRTTTNILLLNLAIADISFLLTCVPFQAEKFVSFSWNHGDWLCKLVQYSLYVTAYVTVWTLACIALMRYLTVVWSAQTTAFRTKKNVSLLCLFIWAASCIVNIFALLGHKVNSIRTYTYCGMVKEMTEPLILSFFICAYALPLFLIVILYLMIIRHLHVNRGRMITTNNRKSRASKACKTIVIVVICFCIAWLPCHINWLLGLYGSTPGTLSFEIYRVISYCMAYGNSCANPLIYNYASEEFRKAFKGIVCSDCCKKRAISRTSMRSMRTTSYRISKMEED